jgi:phospholipid-transporting ATPase
MEKIKFEELDIGVTKPEEKQQQEKVRGNKSISFNLNKQFEVKNYYYNNSDPTFQDKNLKLEDIKEDSDPQFSQNSINSMENDSNQKRVQDQASTAARNQQLKKRRETAAFTNKAEIYFGSDKSHENFINQNKLYGNNRISTTKYNVFTWFPKSLVMQFKRIANIYFLLISILTTLSLSPKSPYSQIFTFIIVLLFSMIKEAIEDYRRYKMDNEINNKLTSVYNYNEDKNEENFSKKFWFELRVGDLVRINKDEALPADILILKSSFTSGLAFVDTKDLDGETNLKEKMVCPEFNKLKTENLFLLEGSIQLDQPNEYMDSWEGNVFVNKYSNDESNNKFISNVNIKQLLLKGCILRNTEYVLGLVVYSGHNTKIMKNAKNPPNKMSNVMRVMNKLLLTVFLFQILICSVFSVMNFMFRFENNKFISIYISIHQEITANSLIQKFFTFLVAYSHLIPISLYVSMEIVKILQSKFVNYDDLMFDYESNKPAQAKTSELIEELGQVQIIFSDKTGTLTQNCMLFKKCFVGEKIFGHVWEEDEEYNYTESESGSESSRNNTKNSSNEKNSHFEKMDNNENNIKIEKLEKHEKIEKKHFNVNGDPAPFKILNNGPSKSYWDIFNNRDNIIPEQKKSLMEFFLVCSVCHSGIVEKDSETEYKYSSSSPDEIALILGAKNMGFTFINRTSETIEVLNSYTNKIEIWEVLVELPFDSDRKRMSLLVKNRDDKNNTVFILTKGADNIMLPRMKMDMQKKSATNDALYRFSCEGLRTLVLGLKTIEYSSFLKWQEKYKKVMLITETSLKENSLNILYEELEKGDFSLAGVTAIEDKLQEGVPETIELLIKSGIRLWVLTGDKKETALIIGKTCRLIEEIGRNDIDLTTDAVLNPKNAIHTVNSVIENKLDELIRTFHIGHVELFQDLMKIELENQYYLITDGNMLIQILKSPTLAHKFFKIGVLCRSVICCRVSPKQKSQVVSMAKNFGKWVTLAVGDGANDVPMIMEAHIGVGIQGKEGTQAVRSADYALCQFKYLQRLILVHGRNGYRRISTFICYYFYKNIILVFAEIYFVFFSGYSGQLFFPDMLSILYNSLWTSWPCIFAYSIEKDLPDDKPINIHNLKYKNNLLGKNFELIPHFYKAGQMGKFFNLKIFWKWLLHAVMHGGMCYTSVTLGLSYISVFNNGKLIDHWWMTTLIFTMIIHVVTYKMFVELSYWNLLVISTAVASILFYYASIYILNLPLISKYAQVEMTNKVWSMFNSNTFWLYVICLPLLCILNDIGIKFYTKFSEPNPIEIFEQNKIRGINKETNNIDVNIIKKLSVIHDPKEIYMYRKSGILPVNKNRTVVPIQEEKDDYDSGFNFNPFESKFELKEILI